MPVAIPRPSSIKQARSNNLPDDHVRLEHISNTKNWQRRISKQYGANSVLSGITLNVQIFLMKFTNS